jgi:hypothetical protein
LEDAVPGTQVALENAVLVEVVWEYSVLDNVR